MANKKPTIMTLNGRRYDAITGRLLADSAAAGQPAGRPISDMVRIATNEPVMLATPKLAAEPLKNLAGPKVMDVSRTTSHLAPRRPARSQTLIRSSVSKPKPGFKSQTKVVAAVNNAISVAPNSVVAKWPVAQVNPQRLTRADQITKSQGISKFAADSRTAEQIAQQSAAVKIQPVEPVAVLAPSAQIAAPSQQSQALFERAMAAADSHTYQPVDQKKLAKQAKKLRQPAGHAKRPVHQHLASVVAASVAVLAIGGVIGLQNKTALTLRFANAKAGFSASLPAYQPEGYGVNNFTYSAGSVGTSFHDATGNRNYNIIQQTTAWDAQKLLDNYVTVNYSTYQAVQSGQTVIYLYGNGNASWIKDGIWYQLTGNGSLSTSQIISIAASV